MLLGAAILGGVAAKFTGVRDAMKALNAAGKVHSFSRTCFKMQVSLY